MYESNIQSLQQKIEEIEKSFQAFEGGMKEQPRLYINNQDAFNRFTEQESNLGNQYHLFSVFIKNLCVGF